MSKRRLKVGDTVRIRAKVRGNRPDGRLAAVTELLGTKYVRCETLPPGEVFSFVVKEKEARKE